MLTGTAPISWTASDADGYTLHYALLYSSDDGQTWEPVALDWPSATFSLSTTVIAGSDQARLRVLATDGVNTGQATSPPFQVERKGPRWVTIAAPEDGHTYPFDALMLLQGSAWDEEDGVLSGTALLWTGSISGTLGTGQDFLVSLPRGWHTITLVATDSDNNHGTDSITIYIGYLVYLPLATCPVPVGQVGRPSPGG